MTLCTQCGAIHHEEDVHICSPGDIPKKGKVKKPQTTEVNI